MTASIMKYEMVNKIIWVIQSNENNEVIKLEWSDNIKQFNENNHKKTKWK